MPTQTEDGLPPPEDPGETPPRHNAPDQPDTSASNVRERAIRDRKPPKYLANYYVGCLNNQKLPCPLPETHINSVYNPGTIDNYAKIGRTPSRNSEEDRQSELPTSTDQLTSHVTDNFAKFEIEIEHSAILSTAPSEDRRVFSLKKEIENKMDPTIAGISNTTTLPGISNILKPPFTEYSSSIDSFSPDYHWENELFEDNECEVDLEEPSVHDYLLDQEVGRVVSTLSPQLPLSRRVPYKEMPNFGIVQTGPLRPIVSVAEAMECEEVGASRDDSPPQVTPDKAATSPQETLPPQPVPSVPEEESSTSPADNTPPEDKTPFEKESEYQQLALPRVLTERPHWTTADTREQIERDCGEAGNRKCRQCERVFSTTRRLRVHVPQHYTNVFCPCGEFSFQRDYVLRHQRIARCHTGQTFVVDAETFPEFRDLVLPHVGDPHKRAILAQGFPACRPTQEGADEATNPVDQPATTQPLRVVLARVDNTRPPTPQNTTHKRRRQELAPPSSTSTQAEKVQCPHEAEVFRLRRHLRRVDDELCSVRRRLERLEQTQSSRRN